MPIGDNFLDNNTTKKVARVFAPAFRNELVASKTVDRGMLTPEFTPQFGNKIDVKLPTRYKAILTNDGDLTAVTAANGNPNAIGTGKAPVTVQQMITVPLEFSISDQALKLDQFEELIKPAAVECAQQAESLLQDHMIANTGLLGGIPKTPITKWGDVASWGSQMKSIGVDTSMPWYALMNPYAIQNLADTQTGLASGSNNLIDTAWGKAQIPRNFAGMQAMTSNSMSFYQTGNTTTRTGTLRVAPTDQTSGTFRDLGTKQVWGVTFGSAATTIKKGEIIRFTGVGSLARSRINLKTRKVAFDQSGSEIPWSVTVLEDVTLDGSGEGDVTVSNPVIFEDGTGSDDTIGQYNNISAKLVDDDAIELLGAAETNTQPNLFYPEKAFGMRSIKLDKLFGWDSTVMNIDNEFSIRVTRYSDAQANLQKMRFDLWIALGVFLPDSAGQGFGE